VPRPLDDLLDEQNAALANDPAWLGSEAQRQWLVDVIHEVPGLEDVRVVWSRHGEPSYWEARTRTIASERLTAANGLAPEYSARMVLLGIVHETLHARFTTPSPLFYARLRSLRPAMQRPLERLFNVLEDGRITPLGKAAEPSMVDALDEHIAASIDQARQLEPKNAETLTPAVPVEQLFYGLVVYALSSEVPSSLRPDIADALDALLPMVDPTRNGTTEDCGEAALKLLREVANFRPEPSP